MNSIRKSISLAQVVRRSMSTNATEVASPKFAKLKKIQAEYGVEDGVPSYLKGGMKDRIFFGVTVLMITVGLGMSAEVLYTLSYPQKD